jgi:hypothetical protein
VRGDGTRTPATRAAAPTAQRAPVVIRWPSVELCEPLQHRVLVCIRG